MNPHELQENSKAVLRRVMIFELQQITSDERAKWSAKICARVFESAEWKAAERLVLFAPLGTEPQIAPLEAAALATGRQVFIIPPTLRNEPELALPFTPDFILVPGLAFTKDHQRLGRGGGFYDRLLAGRAKEAFKLGVCFRLQIRDRIPYEAHDVVLDAVISD